MQRDLILGTAGHIDHGKTTLVKALTGVDCDRLPEEKARGITIDIGFAHLDLPPFRLGIVDVPGHERFVKNMLAGATGIDLALLVVSAKESVKPQTREHLEILKLLGVRQGVIALTMCDLVDDETRELVTLEVRELVRDSFLAAAPIVPTVALSGQGIPELKAALLRACEQLEPRTSKQWFRLPIDRAFIVQGHGTVVTGSVVSGTLALGDEVEWLPRRERVRVRSLQNHDTPTPQVHRGQRAAVNLANVRHDEIHRGQELATPGYLQPSRVLTVRLHCLKDQKRPLRHRQPVRLHLGTAEVMGQISLLDCDTLDPGQWGLAQLFVEDPIVATWGQPFVLREASATQTLGGGQVLQATARKLRRRHIASLERVERLWSGDPAQRVLLVAWFGLFSGVQLADVVREAGVGPEEAAALLETLKTQQKLIEIVLGANRRLLLHHEMLTELENRILGVLDKLHAEFPLLSTHDRQKVQAQLAYMGDDALVHATVDRLLSQKRLLGDLRRIGRADFKPKLSANLRKLKETLIEAYRVSQFMPPDPSSFVNRAGGNAAHLHDLLDVCVAEGYLARITEEIYLHADADQAMKREVVARLREGKGLTVADIRDMLNTSRKFAVPLCEYLDRCGITRREGDLRFLAHTETSLS
jgi:selenocysteine-specific elongation factor